MSYYVDGWTEDYAPTTSNANLGRTTGGTNNWDWYYGSAGVDSGYVQVNATTRRYWYKFRTAGYTFLRLFVYTLPDTMTDKSVEIYKPMVSFGSALADWQEAAEDTADSISAAGNTANAAKTAASEAGSAAKEAKTTADTANSTANTANSTANAAKTAADTANSTANSAKTAASEAKTAAEKATALSGGINCLLGTLAPVTINGNGASAASEMNYVLSEYPGSDTAHEKGGYASGTTICLSFDYDATKYTEGDAWFAIRSQAARRPFEMGKSGHSALVFTLDADTWRGTGGSLVLGGKWTGSITLSHVMWGFGASEQPWGLAAEERELDYLRSALAEATEAQTIVSGGLTLGSMIAVGSSGNALRAGLMGTEQAGGGVLPMVWAGSSAATSDGISNAAFRVYNSGHVEMSDVNISMAGQAGRVEIGNGTMTMRKDNGAVTALTSDSMGNLSTAIGNAGGGTIIKSVTANFSDTKTGSNPKKFTSSPFSITEERSGGFSIDLFTASFNGKMTISGEASKSGSVTSTVAGSANGSYTESGGGLTPVNPDKPLDALSTQSLSPVSTQSQTYLITTKNITVSDWSTCGIGIGKILEDGTSISKGSDGAYTIKKGKKYSVVCSTTARHTASFTAVFSKSGVTTEDMTLTTYTWNSTMRASILITYRLTSTEYVNKYYSDGFMLFQNTGTTDSTRRYAGMSSADATVMMLGSGSSLMKFTADGLMQSLNGGATFVRPPLLFRVTYANNKYSATCINLGKEYDCVRESAGKFTLTHSLGTSNYMAFAQTVHSSNQSSQWYDFAKVITKSSTAITVWIFDRDGSIRDDDCEIAIFRW